MAEPWFDLATFGAYFGCIVGGGGGTLCGLWGAAGGTCAPRGIGRAWLLPSGWLLFAVGIAAVGFGLVALMAGQPFAIWFFPLQSGAIIAILMGVGSFVIGRRYREAEARRMDGEQLRTM